MTCRQLVIGVGKFIRQLPIGDTLIMRTLRFLLQKEFLQIFRDPAIIRIIFMMPIIQLIILPFAADYEIKNINLGVVDQDIRRILGVWWTK